MVWVAGVDGCRNGWVAVLRGTESGALRVRVVRGLREVVDAPEAPHVIGVDAPTGLLAAAQSGGRACDLEARRLLGRLLGRPRAASVFSAPVRGAPAAMDDYRRACAINRASAPCGLGISRQCHGIFGKLAELDALMTPTLQARVREVHPELCFYALNGGASVAARKKSRVGLARRMGLLEAAWRVELAALVPECARYGAARDDVVDAMAACWSAARVLNGTACRVPEDPPRDARGLRMEIWF